MCSSFVLVRVVKLLQQVAEFITKTEIHCFGRELLESKKKKKKIRSVSYRGRKVPVFLPRQHTRTRVRVRVVFSAFSGRFRLFSAIRVLVCRGRKSLPRCRGHRPEPAARLQNRPFRRSKSSVFASFRFRVRHDPTFAQFSQQTLQGHNFCIRTPFSTHEYSF